MTLENLNHHIVRLQYKSWSGWQVEVSIDGVRHNKAFGDSEYGGSRAALLVARDYRDKLFEKLKRPMVENVVIRDKGRIIGVKKVGQRYVAYLPENGESVTFSIKQFGEDGAFFRAYHARRKSEKKKYGRYLS